MTTTTILVAMKATTPYRPPFPSAIFQWRAASHNAAEMIATRASQPRPGMTFGRRCDDMPAWYDA